MREYRISMQSLDAIADGRVPGTIPVIDACLAGALDQAERIARERSGCLGYLVLTADDGQHTRKRGITI